jgi:predicted permease
MDLNSEPRQIVGVMPASFFPVPDAQVWIPMQADPASATRGDYLHLAARLKPGVSIAEAREEMAILGERFRKLNPKVMDDKESIAVTGLRDAMVEYTREALYILLAAVGLVLLLACANVASLLLARALSRQRELAIRAAIGASRARVIRQLLTESVLLSTIGGVLGSLLGVWGVRALLLLVPAHIPRIGSAVQLTDWRVLGFTISISMLTGIVFGLVPALQLSNPNLASTLKEAGTRSTTGRRQNFIRKTLVAVEMALAIILLIGAALLIRTFVGLRTAETGIDPNHVLTMTTSLSGRRYQTTEAQYLLTSQALKKIEAIPGVEAASCATTLPARGAIDLDFTIVGKPVSPGQNATGDVQWRGISPHHFNVFRGPVKRGRVFNDHDTPTSAPVVVVNSAFAEKFFKNENPIGKSLIVGTGPGLKEAPREIVGIVADVREAGIARGPEPVMYVPQSQQQQAMTQILNSPSWAIRSTIDQTSLIAAVTKAIQSVDGQLALANVKTMDSILHEGLARQSFNMLLLSIFAASALLLAAIGIYG